MQCRSHRGSAQRVAALVLSLGGAVPVPHLQASIRSPDRPSRQILFLNQPTQRLSGSTISDMKSLLSITVDFDMKAGDEGLLLAGGNDSEAFRLYVKNGRLVWAHDYVLRESFIVIASAHLPAGPIHARCEFDSVPANDASQTGNGRLIVNGQIVGQVTHNIPRHFTRCHPQKLVGASDDSFTGAIKKITLEQR